MYNCSHNLLPQKYTRFGSERLPVDDKGNLYWHLANWGTDMDRFHQIGILQNVFQTWQPYFIPWQFRSTQDFDSAQWHIYFVKKNIVTMPDGTKWNVKDRGLFDFQKNKDTLAVQYASPNLLCLINDDHDYSFSTKGPNAYDLYTVLVHEMGHGFLLGHTDQAAVKKMKALGLKPIMAPYYDKGGTVTPDEEEGIRDLHGAHLREFRDHPTILRIMQTFAEAPSSIREPKRSFWDWLFG